MRRPHERGVRKDGKVREMDTAMTTHYRCPICGYIHEGDLSPLNRACPRSDAGHEYADMVPVEVDEIPASARMQTQEQGAA